MIRLACLITTAISFCCTDAYAVGPFELNVRVQNAGSTLEQQTRLCGLKPRGLNGETYAWQVSASSEVALVENQYCLDLGAVGPYQSQYVPLQWRPLEKINAVQHSSALAYDLVDNPSPALLELARSFESYPAGARVMRIFDWMVRNVAFSGIRRGIDGAEHALLTKQGDCSEHMLLAGELLERNGVTIRRVLGVALAKDQYRITAPTLHNWIEYQDNGSWLVFDSSRQVLGTPEQQNYVALLFYESSQQLNDTLLAIDPPRLKLYLQ